MSMSNSVPGDDWMEQPGEHPLWTLNRDVAERLAGPEYGRPTISRRTGRVLSRATGVSEEDGVNIFHAVLLLAGALVGVAAVSRA
jgi:hypothetical protein